MTMNTPIKSTLIPRGKKGKKGKGKGKGKGKAKVKKALTTMFDAPKISANLFQ